MFPCWVSQPNPKVDAYRKYKIGIIGAGSAGLITRLIFDHLKELYGPDVDYEILEVNNLAQLYSSSKAEYDEVQEIIEKNYETHFAYDWYAGLGTTGAFTYFGPGQFRNLYPYIVRNDGTHIIIEEASSAHHA
ncbi:MAG: hypothetical protein LQ341_001360 [Variospora aurantia]|nr:MAG: hypothetical protein LQ341_001360 [Variospora aurantia]